jgi:hypothetical protein
MNSLEKIYNFSASHFSHTYFSCMSHKICKSISNVGNVSIYCFYSPDNDNVPAEIFINNSKINIVSMVMNFLSCLRLFAKIEN